MSQGYVIEQTREEIYGRMVRYWDGKNFTPTIAEALRFLRRLDGQRAIRSVPYAHYCRVVPVDPEEEKSQAARPGTCRCGCGWEPRPEAF